jgi:hypothetical protein
MGTNILAGTKKESILNAFEKAVARPRNQFKVPPKWDGKAAERIWKILLKKNKLDRINGIPKIICPGRRPGQILHPLCGGEHSGWQGQTPMARNFP